MTTFSRREFLKTPLLTGSAAPLARQPVVNAAEAAASPNGEIRVAVVGCRGKGAHHIKMFGEISGARLAALCDVDRLVLDSHVKKLEAKKQEVTTCRDCRKLLEDKTIDAVVIATPNHWHSLMTVWAWKQWGSGLNIRHFLHHFRHRLLHLFLSPHPLRHPPRRHLHRRVIHPSHHRRQLPQRQTARKG